MHAYCCVMASSDSDSEAASSSGEGDSRESATQSRNFASDIADTLALLTDPSLRRGPVLGSITRYKSQIFTRPAQHTFTRYIGNK